MQEGEGDSLDATVETAAARSMPQHPAPEAASASSMRMPLWVAPGRRSAALAFPACILVVREATRGVSHSAGKPLGRTRVDCRGSGAAFEEGALAWHAAVLH